MIIDTHVHIGKMINFDLKEEDVLYSMERYGIDFSLVSDIEAARSVITRAERSRGFCGRSRMRY